MHVKIKIFFHHRKEQIFTPTDDHIIMMLSTKQEDRFIINGTAKKLTLYIKNLIETIDAKIVNTPESKEAEAWKNYKQAGLADIRDRIGLHKCVIGTDPPPGEPLQTSLKKIMKELVKNVPCVDDYFHFQNIDNSTKTATLIATKKIVNTPKMADESKLNKSVDEEPTNGWEKIPEGKGNRMVTSPTGETNTMDKPISKNSFGYLTDSDEHENESDASTIVETLYDQFDDENRKPDTVSKNVKTTTKSDDAWNKTINILSKHEYETIETVIKQGKTNTLDLDILCKWIMHKNVDVLNACGQLDDKVVNWNNKFTTNVQKDHQTMLTTSKLAMTTFTDHVNTETKESTKALGTLKIDMENIEKRTKRNLQEHSKSVEKLKSEVKKAENEGISAINTLSNMKLRQIKQDITKAQDVTDKLNGTKAITDERKKEINNLMVILSKRLEGLSDKFDENISIISDNEKMNVMQWMEKRREFIKSDTNDVVIQQMIKLKKELESTLDAVTKERKLITEERELLEGDRAAFYQWWQSIKATTMNNKFTFGQGNKDLSIDTTRSAPIDSNDNWFDEPVYTFKQVDKHDPQPARSPTNGRVDQEAPQPNQQIYKVDHFTEDQFPSTVDNPLKDGTPIVYDYTVFKCQGTINYQDNLPTYISDTWFYDIRTLNGIKLTNCSGRYIRLNYENVPTNIHGATTTSKVRNPYIKKKTQQVHNPYRQRSTTPPRRSRSPSRANNQYQNQHDKPWLNKTKQLGPNEFIYPLDTAPITVRHHELIKYGNKLNLTIHSKDEFRQFYEDFRNQLKTYNIFLVEYDQVELDKSLAEITPENCENYNVAIKEMSRAIFQFFSFNKETVFATYDAPIHSLDTYRPSGNGFRFLMNIMKRIHPRLKRNVVEFDQGLTTMPRFDEYTTIHKFINAIVIFRQDELQNGRSYTTKDLLTHIASTLDERFETAVEVIKKELKLAFTNKSHPKPIPEYLNIDSELAITIIDMLDSDEKDRDLTNPNPKPRGRSTINRLNTSKGDYQPSYRKQSDKPKSYKGSDTKWADELHWKIIEGAECPGCKRSNHNVYSTGCPAFAQFAICQEFYNKCPPKQLEKVKSKFTEYQRDRRQQMKERKRTGKATIKKFVSKGYDEEDMAQVKLAFFESYKDDFKEEQYLKTNPFDNLDQDDDTDHDQNEVKEEEV